VVVLHPGRVFTLYAGLESLRVAPEDVLSFGDPVGSVGDRLYFEIRADNRPQDPTRWLR
jgi:septal ring factor EnvC (AmiA/AmiB activator)